MKHSPCVLPPPQAVSESQPLSPVRPSSTFASLEHSPRAFSLRRRRCGNHSPSHLYAQATLLLHWNIPPVRSLSAAGGAGIIAPLTCTPKQHFCCIETFPPCVLPPPQAVRESQPLSPARQSSTFAALKHSPPCVLSLPQAVRESQPLSPARPSSTFAALKHSPVRSPSAAGGAETTALSPIRPNAAFVALKRATNTEICPNQNIYHLFAQFQDIQTVCFHKRNA